MYKEFKKAENDQTKNEIIKAILINRKFQDAIIISRKINCAKSKYGQIVKKIAKILKNAGYTAKNIQNYDNNPELKKLFWNSLREILINKDKNVRLNNREKLQLRGKRKRLKKNFKRNFFLEKLEIKEEVWYK